jgi:hypothetical protein
VGEYVAVMVWVVGNRLGFAPFDTVIDAAPFPFRVMGERSGPCNESLNCTEPVGVELLVTVAVIVIAVPNVWGLAGLKLTTVLVGWAKTKEPTDNNSGNRMERRLR